MKLFYIMAILYLFQPLAAFGDNDRGEMYIRLNHFGDYPDEESVVLLEKTAESIGLTDKQFLLFFVREEFPCCAQVFPHVYDDQEYLIVRIWKSLFDELTIGERRALFGHELMHVKNGDLTRKSSDLWLTERIQNLYIMLASGACSIELQETVRFSMVRWLNYACSFLAIKMALNEGRYLYDHYEQREREKRAEFGAARSLKCARDSLSLNDKIGDRLRQEGPKDSFPLTALINYVASYYDTHPSRHYFSRELAKMAQEQEIAAISLGKL